MTIYARFARTPARLAARRERLELLDGDFVDVDHFPSRSPDGPVAVVCHGLEGSSRSPYVRCFAGIALASGFSVAALNFRGCSGELNRLPRSYHAGDTGDLDELVRRLCTERSGRPVVVVGFSLGGNVVAKWFADAGESLPALVRAGAVVSAPFDLGRCADALDAPGFMPRVYRERHLRTMRAKAIARARRFPGLLDREAASAARTLRRFDDLVTAPLHGFAGVEDYYRRASSGPRIGSVRRPLLLISATDDPLIPPDAIPLDAARANPAIALEVHPVGGHVAFVSGVPWRPAFWAEVRAVRFLAAAVGL
jgi:predicted alpha/beta-fold hydrolase